MRRRAVIAGLTVLACAPRPEAPARDTVGVQLPPPVTGGLTLEATRLGPYRVGMSLAELNAALGEQLVPAYQMNPTCDHVDPAGLPDGVIVMIENDTVARFDVESPAVRTREGAGVGDTEATVVARYGADMTVEPHKYTGPEGHYLVLRPPGDSLHEVIFETDGRVVTHLRAGRLPSVAYVEGCA